MQQLDVVLKKYLDDRVQVDVNYRESFIRKLTEKVEEMGVTLERADRISHSAFVDVGELEARFNDTQEIHIRDANRIASLELTVMGLNERLIDAERNVIIQADGEVFSVKERVDALESTLDDHQSTLDDLECVVEDKVDRDEVEDMIESNEHIERVVRDNIEEFIVDAVRNEIDAADFKVIVER